jgi:hypothetical protein
MKKLLRLFLASWLVASAIATFGIMSWAYVYPALIPYAILFLGLFLYVLFEVKKAWSYGQS